MGNYFRDKANERNPERIKPFLAQLEEFWTKMPDLRFAQVVDIFEAMLGQQKFFNMEEDELIQHIKTLSDETIVIEIGESNHTIKW